MLHVSSISCDLPRVVYAVVVSTGLEFVVLFTGYRPYITTRIHNVFAVYRNERHSPVAVHVGATRRYTLQPGNHQVARRIRWGVPHRPLGRNRPLVGRQEKKQENDVR